MIYSDSALKTGYVFDFYSTFIICDYFCEKFGPYHQLVFLMKLLNLKVRSIY